MGRVLVADDDPYVLRHLCNLVEEAGYSVGGKASNPTGALRLMALEEFDLLLTDLNFKTDSTGADLIRRWTGMSGGKPAILVSIGINPDQIETFEESLPNTVALDKANKDVIIKAIQEALG